VILAMELRAVLRASEGANDEAIALLRDAAKLEEALPLEYGPPDVVKPTQELLGELLLTQAKPVEAQQAFVRALALTPRRALSLLGLARAATMAGDSTAAAAAYADLRQVWHRADADLPGLSEVTRQPAQTH